jgi:NitT/TauT family transport system ATP-binding protein
MPRDCETSGRAGLDSAEQNDMLKIQNVTKVYGDPESGYLALDGIDLEIEDGEFLCLLGASGCGKTTLLNILAGFESITGGTVSLSGRLLTSAGRDRVMFFQDAGSALFPWLTVEDNVQFGLKLRGMPARKRQEVTDKYLEMVNLIDHRKKLPAQLSGGMRQRLQIARALAIEPDVLLMDEPFAALDALTRRRMHVELLDIWERTGKTIVFVTHDIGESVVLAERIAIMTLGPGSRIKAIIRVELPRPRDPGDPAVGQLYSRIEDVLAGELARVVEGAR